MNKKIFALLVIFIATVSVATVVASEDLTSHDFGDFKMNIPTSQEDISQKQGDANQTIYAVPNTDLSNFAFIEYWDTSNTNGNNNTTDFVLNKVKTNHTVDSKDGIYSWSAEEQGHGEQGYLVSSDDNTKIVVITSSDTRIQDAVKSVEFK